MPNERKRGIRARLGKIAGALAHPVDSAGKAVDKVEGAVETAVETLKDTVGTLRQTLAPLDDAGTGEAIGPVRDAAGPADNAVNVPHPRMSHAHDVAPPAPDPIDVVAEPPHPNRAQRRKPHQTQH
jgi:hypothetical protein